MASDLSVLDAYRKQLRSGIIGDPEQTFLVWWISGERHRGEITDDDLIDGYKAVTQTDPPAVT